MPSRAYEFCPLTAADLALVGRWLAAPHAARWWGAPGAQFALVSGDPRGSRGIDQFIGEPHMIGRGHGSACIAAFVDRLRAAGCPRVLTDPHPANRRAIRAYQKAGFARQRAVDTADGRALLMIRDSNRAIAA